MIATNKKSKIGLLENTASIYISDKYKVVKKKLDTIEVTFSKESYPVLGINLECFDNPKITSMEQITNLLCDNLKIDKNVIKIDDIYKLNYEIKIDKEKLFIWKLLHHLKPRSFRLLRLSLTCPDNKEVCMMT